MSAKDELRGKIDDLSELEAQDTLRFIEVRRTDPMIAAIASAPPDDEPFTEGDRDAVEQALAQHRRGESVPFDEIRHEFE